MSSAIMDYVVLDIETTGLNPKYEKIIELGAARVCNGEVKETFSTFINPAKSLPPRITELTGIYDRDVINAPYIEDIFGDFVDFVGDGILLGHNLIFDYSFVKKAAVNQKVAFDKEGIDTLRIARRFMTELESRSLNFLCEHYGIVYEAHRALNDALAAHKLYQQFVVDFYEKEQDTFKPCPLVYNVKKESPITQRQYEHILRLAGRFRLATYKEDEHVFLEPIDGVNTERLDVGRLTKSEASRIIDRLLSKFANSL